MYLTNRCRSLTVERHSVEVEGGGSNPLGIANVRGEDENNKRNDSMGLVEVYGAVV